MGGHTEPQRHAGATWPPEEPGGACVVTTRVTRVFRHRPAGEAESSCLLAARPKRLRLPEPASRGGLLAGSAGTGSSHSRAARPRALQLRTRPIHCPVHSWEGGGQRSKTPTGLQSKPCSRQPSRPRNSANSSTLASSSPGRCRVAGQKGGRPGLAGRHTYRTFPPGAKGRSGGRC